MNHNVSQSTGSNYRTCRPAFQVLLILIASAARSQSLTTLPYLPGGNEAMATAVSGDGWIGCGYSLDATATYRAVIWNRSSVISKLGPFNGESYANGISANGRYVVGRAKHPGANDQAFRQQPGQSFSMLGYLTAVSPASIAGSANDDGAIVVGQSLTASGIEPFRRSGSSLSGLGFLPSLGVMPNANTMATDATGSIIVGWFDDSAGKKRGYFWNGAIAKLLPLSGYSESAALGINREGTKAYGYSIKASGQLEACTWTSPFSAYPFGAGYPLSYQGSAFNAGACSVFGGFIVTTNGSHEAAFQGPMSGNSWTTVKNYMASKGIQVPTGITLREVKGISADGTTLVGFGRDTAQHLVPWRARLTPTSEVFPSAAGPTSASLSGSIYNLALTDSCSLNVLQQGPGPCNVVLGASPTISTPTSIKMFVSGTVPLFTGGTVTVKLYNWHYSYWSNIATFYLSSGPSISLNTAISNPQDYVFTFFGVPLMFGKIELTLYPSWFSSPTLSIDRFGWDVK